MTKRVSRAAAGVWAAVWLAACSGKTPENDIPPPDADAVLVFYPASDGLARGRGLPGTFPPSVTHVLVQAHPTGTSSLQPVEADGSFQFAVIAISGDLLEIAGTTDDLGNVRGASLYVEVPASPLPAEDFVCCRARGTCQKLADAEAGRACPDPLTGATQCSIDEECGVDELEYLPIDLQRIQVGRPNELGRVDVSGIVTANALVLLENRGLNGIGVPGQRFRSAQISSDVGAFSFQGLTARGDDELVLRVQDLNGYRTPAVSLLVPDAELAGLDILGAFAWEPLTNGQRGPVAVHLSPFGVDGKGICPDTDEAPEVCFSGGLTYAMVNVVKAQMRVGQETPELNPSPAPITPERPHNRGAEGDVRSAAQDLVVVIDISKEAQDKDGKGLAPPRRFEAAARFVEGLRQRDRVAVVSYAGNATRELVADPGRDSGLRTLEQRGELAAAVRGLSGREFPTGSNLFAGIREAAAALRLARSRNGRIVVLAGAAPGGMASDAVAEWSTALDAVQEDLSKGLPRITVDVVGLDIPSDAPNFGLIDDITRFTDGRYYTSSAFGIEQTLTDVRSFLSGSFILLYDMDIPAGVGKSGTIDLELEVILGSERARTTYTGPLRILNSSNN
jgi:hypothetical protein